MLPPTFSHIPITPSLIITFYQASLLKCCINSHTKKRKKQVNSIYCIVLKAVIKYYIRISYGLGIYYSGLYVIDCVYVCECGCVSFGSIFKQSVPGLGTLHNGPVHTHICRECGRSVYVCLHTQLGVGIWTQYSHSSCLTACVIIDPHASNSNF